MEMNYLKRQWAISRTDPTSNSNFIDILTFQLTNNSIENPSSLTAMGGGNPPPPLTPLLPISFFLLPFSSLMRLKPPLWKPYLLLLRPYSTPWCFIRIQQLCRLLLYRQPSVHCLLQPFTTSHPPPSLDFEIWFFSKTKFVHFKKPQPCTCHPIKLLGLVATKCLQRLHLATMR
jgi:hypothetical protein